MHVKANTTPASAPGGYAWEHEDAVVEVPDDLGTELVRIAGQFSEVLPTDPAHPNYEPTGGEDDLIGALGEDAAEAEQVGAELQKVMEQGDQTLQQLNDVLGAGTTPEKKPCGREGCGNFAKPGQDFCHWHQPKN